MKIIVVEPNLDLRTIIRLNFVKLGEAQVIEKDSFDDIHDWKSTLPEIRHCLIRTEILNQVSQNQLSLLEKNQFEIVNLDSDILNFTNGKLDFDHSKFDRVIRERFFLTESTSEEFKKYVPVPIDYFYHINELNFNTEVFLKIKGAESDRFVKRLDANDKFTFTEIDKYKLLGVSYFYVPQHSYENFANYLTDKLMLKMMEQGEESTERLKVESSTFQMTLERIHSIGIDDRTIDAVNETIKSIESSIKKNEALADYFNKLKDNNASYSYSHSYLISLFLHKVVDCFEWKSESIKDKLTFVAYFHDIALKTDDLIKASKDEPTLKNCSDKVKKLVYEHAYLGATIVGKFPNAPIGASQIICEHHGIKTGMGESQTLNLNIQQLSKVFMVVEDFVTHYLSFPEAPKKDVIFKMISLLKRKYNKDVYYDAISHLETIINSTDDE